MPKVYCYLNQKIIDELEKIKETEEYESSSQVMKEMITLGIKVYQMNSNNSEIDEAEKLAPLQIRSGTQKSEFQAKLSNITQIVH